MQHAPLALAALLALAGAQPVRIRDDVFPASAAGPTWGDVLSNDALNGAPGPLRVTAILPHDATTGSPTGSPAADPTAPPTACAARTWHYDRAGRFCANAAPADPAGLAEYASRGECCAATQAPPACAFADACAGDRRLRGDDAGDAAVAAAVREAGAQPSLFNGTCAVTGNRERVRYTPPDPPPPPGARLDDYCSYRACADGGFGAGAECGEARIAFILRPSENPTANPTTNPTAKPTAPPTVNPSYNPTSNPTRNPTLAPTLPSPAVNADALGPVTKDVTYLDVLANDAAAAGGGRLTVTDVFTAAPGGPTGSPVESPATVPAGEPTYSPTASFPTYSPTADFPTYSPTSDPPTEAPASAPTTEAPASVPPTEAPGSSFTFVPTYILLPGEEEQAPGTAAVRWRAQATEAAPGGDGPGVRVGKEVASAAGGACAIVGDRSRLRYTAPPAPFAGEDACAYEACDERGRCGTARVAIDVVRTARPGTNPTVNPTASPSKSPGQSPTANPTANPTYNPTASPTLAPAVLSVPTINPTVGGPVDRGVKYVDVLANDRVAAGGGRLRVTDVFTRTSSRGPVKEEASRRDARAGGDGPVVMVGKEVASAAGGACAITGNRQRLRYTAPPAPFAGRDTCVYAACDEQGRCGTARVSFRVVGNTLSPSAGPTKYPSSEPTANPTTNPMKPTLTPTTAPTLAPTHGAVTRTPTGSPTGSPTWSPTSSPHLPSSSPTPHPTDDGCGGGAGASGKSKSGKSGGGGGGGGSWSWSRGSGDGGRRLHRPCGPQGKGGKSGLASASAPAGKGGKSGIASRASSARSASSSSSGRSRRSRSDTKYSV